MKVNFLKNISDFKPTGLPKNTYIIYHAMYEPPNIKGVKDSIEFQKYKNVYMDIEPDMLILIGINRIINPSNRCNFIYEHLTTLTPNIDKISVDNEPFIGECWRCYFHYQFANTGNFHVPHSFAIETEWKRWFYREKNTCRLSGNNIKLMIDDTYSDLTQLKTSFDFFELSDYEKNWYKEIKDIVFEQYSTPKLLINNLLKYCNKYFSLDISYDTFKENRHISLPDIGIYRFMVEENKRKLDTYNAIIK